MNGSPFSGSPFNGKTALVVDDEQSTREIVSAILEAESISVTMAESGEQALYILREQTFDVVITDVCMDGISGLDLLEEIGRLDSSIKTVIMTAHSSFDVVLKALQGGAYDYIEKPISDLARVASTAHRASMLSKLERDNSRLLANLKTSNEKLAYANEMLVKYNKKLEQLAETDVLTNLKNRRFIDNVLKKQLTTYKRYKNAISLLLVDIDHFKIVNDTYGHVIGDKILQYVSNILKENSRESDWVGRYGGEEFLLVLGNTEEEGALVVANRIVEQVDLPIIIDGDEYSVTVSVGLASLDGDEEVIELTEFIERCDLALYRAKDAGRNCLKVYDEDLDVIKTLDQKRAAG